MRRPPAAPQPPLLEVLGASWVLGAPVTGLAWNGLTAGFALGDGSLATARGEWEGAAKLASVEGGAQLTPASAPAPPMVRQRVHVGPCSAVAALADGGFVTGGADGALVRSAADGVMTELEGDPSRPVELVAAAAGRIAAASGRRVSVSGPSAHRLELPAFATAMAFHSAGPRLAVAHGRGVTLWSEAGGERVLEVPGVPVSVAWSLDGSHLVCGLAEGALHAWRMADGPCFELGAALGSHTGQPGSLSFSGDGRMVASSGGPQAACWRLDVPAGSPPVLCSLSNTPFPVCRVACHPANSIIAVGYGNGAVLLSQPGLDDVLFVKGPTGGAVTALEWSADGACLAMGTVEGEVGVAALPALLFRASPSQASPSQASPSQASPSQPSPAQPSPAQAGTNPQQRSAMA